MAGYCDASDVIIRARRILGNRIEEGTGVGCRICGYRIWEVGQGEKGTGYVVIPYERQSKG